MFVDHQIEVYKAGGATEQTATDTRWNEPGNTYDEEKNVQGKEKFEKTGKKKSLNHPDSNGIYI